MQNTHANPGHRHRGRLAHEHMQVSCRGHTCNQGYCQVNSASWINLGLVAFLFIYNWPSIVLSQWLFPCKFIPVTIRCFSAIIVAKNCFLNIQSKLMRYCSTTVTKTKAVYCNTVVTKGQILQYGERITKRSAEGTDKQQLEAKPQQ